MKSATQFKGTSAKGNLQEALDAAIQEAVKALGGSGADMLVRWRVESIQGERGGIQGLRAVQVAIEASV
jgi:hypothetical protein